MNIDIKFEVTASAAEELKKAAAESMVRVFAQAAGCSGNSYGLGLEDEISPSDFVEEISGVKFVVDRSSLMLLDGVTLDWQSVDDQQGFKFLNSNAPGGCCRKGGCSKS